MWKVGRVILLAGFIAIAGTAAFLGALTRPASADPEAGQSVDVAIIGSPGVINGGDLIVSGPAGGLGDFAFTNLAPANVSAANLAAFDTAVLNVASSQMGCNVNTLSASAKADLVAFVSGGGKLIIYDSECSAQDYSWLPYPFTTSNPGAYGATGTLTIAEEDVLASANEASPHYIDAVSLGEDTDAVGDMNVMTTLDAHWCLSMSGTNVEEVTGPVHTYARYGSGLMIYNGLDVDYLGDEPSPPYPNGLEKIWLQELQAPLSPSQSDLPCSQLVIGTPTSRTIVHSATPTFSPTATITRTPVPGTSTPVPTNTAIPPQPTATLPSGGVSGAITAPSTGSGPGSAGTPGELLLAALTLIAGGISASTAAMKIRRRQ